MPRYTFMADDGDCFDQFYVSAANAPDEIVQNNKTYIRQLNFGSYVQVKNGRDAGGKPCSTWPMESEALGVAPQDAPRAMAEDRRLGVPTDYSREGNPIFNSAKHRKQWCKAHGYHDRNAGFSDATPD